MFEPSKYQVAIFEAIESGTGDLVVEAVAGSGKTTTLVEACKRLKPGTSALFCAFNKAIATELGARLNGSGVQAQTLHSLGKQALERHLDTRTRVDGRKPYKLIDRYIRNNLSYLIRNRKEDRIYLTDEGRLVQEALLKLLDFCRLTLTDPTNQQALIQMCLHYEISIDDRALAALPQLIEWDENQAREQFEIDFTDMIWLPVRWNIPMPTYQWVFVDESQDLNKCQLELVLKCRQPGGRMAFVGDRHQCQPAGTMVSVVRSEGNKWHHANVEQVPIETLRVGDRVITYAPRECSFEMRGHPIKQIAKRPYDGELIYVQTPDDHVSRYTPNHRCYANFEPLRNHYAVYMMQSGERFRIGKAKMDYTGKKGGITASGPIARARAEKATRLWILAVYETEEEALIMEGAIAGRFGLPRLTFQVPGGADQRDQELLDKAWNFIGDTVERADQCLRFFGRKLQYPIYYVGDHEYRSFKRPMEVYACNLIDGALVLPFEDEAHTAKVNWLPVKVWREHYHGEVYSLEVSKNPLYIADGLVTHNSIYGFAGADNRSIPQIIERTNAQVLPLSICYRCPSSVIKLAQEVIPHIEAKPGVEEGKIIQLPSQKLPQTAQPGDLIVCRLTAPLISECISFIKRGIPARVEGRDIGKQLTEIVKKVALRENFIYDDFLRFLSAYRMQQAKMLADKDADETQITSWHDRCDAVEACYQELGAPDVDSLCAKIESLFDEEKPLIKLATIHRVKGLESDRVFIIAPEKLPLLVGGWQQEQEWNLRYVAVTRAKQELYIVGGTLTPGPHANGQTPEPVEDEPEIIEPKLDPPVDETPEVQAEETQPAVVEPQAESTETPVQAEEPPAEEKPKWVIKASPVASILPEPTPQITNEKIKQATLVQNALEGLNAVEKGLAVVTPPENIPPHIVTAAVALLRTVLSQQSVEK